MNDIKKRLSNFELLRIISIIMIIMHHYSVHGNWINKLPGLLFNNLLIDFFAIGGKIGVICFILITGYFGIESKFSIKKIIKLVLQVLFYTIGCYIIFNIIKFEQIQIGLKVLIKSVLPVTFSMYWFITAYVVLYILSPYINKLVKGMTKQENKRLVVILCILCCIIPTFTSSSLGLGDVTLFTFIYIVGAYIRLYMKDYRLRKTISSCVFIASWFLMFLSQIIFEYLGRFYTVFSEHINYFIGLNSILVLIASISLFALFKELKIESRGVNIIASTSFGIYLIHENYFVREYIWQILFKNNDYYNSSFLWLHALISITIVYIVGMLIELFRIYVIEKNSLPWIYNLYDNLEIKIKRIISRKKVKQ